MDPKWQSIFPHPASAWWIPVLIAVGWGPIEFCDIFGVGSAEEFGMPWGMGVALPCTYLAALSVPVQAFRLLMFFLNRPKPE